MHAPAPAHSALIDWLRFGASLAVVFRHARVDHWVSFEGLSAAGQAVPAALLAAGLRIGHEAVVTFFVLSGFLIGGKLWRRCSTGTFVAGDYFRDRLTRIYTPLLPALGLTAACVWYLHGALPQGYGLDILGHVLQLQGVVCERIEGNAPLWTLAYETWFYSLAGAVAVLVTGTRASVAPGRLLPAALLALASIACLAVLDSSYLFCWLFGAVAAAAPWKLPRRAWAIIALVALGATGAACKQLSILYGEEFIRSAELLHSVGNLLVGAAVALALPLLLNSGARFANAAPRLAALGTRLAGFSYTLYLVHFPLLLVMRSHHEPFASINSVSILVYAAKIATCMVAAWLFYLPFERNTSRVRAWFKSKSPAPAKAVPSHA